MTVSARRIQQLLSWLGDRDRQLQLALDAAELGTWNWDPSTNELVWSDRCRTLIGVSADETPTVDTFLKLVHADDRPAVEAAIASALHDGDSYSIEYRIVLPDGEIRWLHSLGRVHQADSRGRTLGMSGVVRDVTLAHRAAEAALRQEQYLEQLRRQDAQQRIDQRYRLLVDTLPLGIMLSDPDGLVTYVNPAWTILGATSREQVIGQEQMIVVHPQDRVRVHSLWQRLRQELTADFEFRVAAEGGEPRWVHCISTALRDGNGIVLGYAHACVDISGHRQQRAAIELRHDQVLGLAHRLQRLRQSERLDLAGLLQREIVHDLGTLQDALAAVGNAASLHDARSAASRALALIGSTTEQLRRIVHELNPPGIEELGFAGALERSLSDQSERAGFEFDLVMPEAPMLAQPRILSTLYAVAQEAIINIGRHAAASFVHVSVSIGEGSVHLQVRDNGVGIAPDAWPRPHCHGLLAASERLAEIGGTLQTTGAPGKGTVLDARVPLLQASRPLSES